jgi:hypothetical protein
MLRFGYVLTACALICSWRAAADVAMGPLFHEFGLTLDRGHRTEVAGPLFYSEDRDSMHTWAVPPVMSHVADETTDFTEFDLLYPVLTYDRFGPEYRFQILQVFAFAGGQTYAETNVHRFTLFPIYFHQWSADPERNYWALVPLYGHLRGRLFRDDIRFLLWPLYSRTRKRDVVTYNFPYPFLHVRHGDGLHGWQFWPLFGTEHKDVTSRTNMWDETETVGGHDRYFVLWPFYFNSRTGIGTTNVVKQEALLPAYSVYRSPNRDSSTFFWPFGITHTVDREKKYNEWGTPWPLIIFARGEGKETSRVWPFYSDAHTDTLTSRWYLWPVYKYNRVHSDPLDRERTRILLYLYSDVSEKNTETGTEYRRRDLWPLFTARKDLNGNTRLQILSILEPILPNNKSIERNYSPLWSLWRSEKNAHTKATSQSLLWNLYRRDSSPEAKKCSLLFGLFQYQSSPKGARWRVFYVPFGSGEEKSERYVAPTN